MSDQDFINHRAHANLGQYAALEAIYCQCDALCTCGWDDDDLDLSAVPYKPVVWAKHGYAAAPMPGDDERETA